MNKFKNMLEIQIDDEQPAHDLISSQTCKTCKSALRNYLVKYPDLVQCGFPDCPMFLINQSAA